MTETFPLAWEVGPHREVAGVPERFVPATVPGAVQLDWAAAHEWPPFWQGDNFRQYTWMEDAYWTYRTMLRVPADLADRRVVFACGGIDYAFDVLLNGEVLLSQEGMFTPIELDLTGQAKDGDMLSVRVHPVPKGAASPIDRSQANRSCKPAVSYGWDFHPRLVPLGIWQPANLELRPASSFGKMAVTYRFTDDFSRAYLTLNVVINGRDSLRWSLVDSEGIEVGKSTTSTMTVENPALWWPHDQGTPARYRAIVELLNEQGEVIDRKAQWIGFRRVRLVMHEGAWIEPSRFPKSRSTPPITLEINGRRVFAKGANWVSPHIFPGAIDEALLREQLQLVHDSNMNMLRMWGGAPAQQETFYEICDQLGIMVWQEFPLACNNYPDDERYLQVLEQEARSIVNRLRTHPSVVLWCGGNELFNSWSGMTDQSHALRLLNGVCFEQDRHTPFLPTSPVMGMGHGHYTFRDAAHDEEAWTTFQKSSCTAYTEFGIPGPASVEVLRQIIPADELFPPTATAAWTNRHAFNVWQDDSWLDLKNIEHYFGKQMSIEQIVANGQLLQAEGYRGLFEEARRQKPVSAMALNWCLNEPWPTAANNSLLSWPTKPKPALAAVSESCRPVLASARVRKFLWREGEWFDPELWMLSDAPEAQLPLHVVCSIRAAGEELKLLKWDCPALRANTNQRGPRVQFQLPRFDGIDRFELVLTVADRPALDSIYVLGYRASSSRRHTGTATMNL